MYLKRYPPTDDDSDYISAVYVDGVKLQNQYIATQLPLPGTVGDFWRMVDEYKVELIVKLQPPDPDDTVRSFLYLSPCPPVSCLPAVGRINRDFSFPDLSHDGPVQGVQTGAVYKHQAGRKHRIRVLYAAEADAEE